MIVNKFPRWPESRDFYLSDWLARQVALPEDVIDCEVTYRVLFQLSVMLNRVTGGVPDMTFSARAHLSGVQARSLPLRAWWRLCGSVIDGYCRIARGETDHCATAWRNFLLRGGSRATETTP